MNGPGFAFTKPVCVCAHMRACMYVKPGAYQELFSKLFKRNTCIYLDSNVINSTVQSILYSQHPLVYFYDNIQLLYEDMETIVGSMQIICKLLDFCNYN